MKPFQFKEFAVRQDKCAMKIGTDAVLLGAWATIDDYPDSILDIGAGTGVISLMLAQRCDALTIDGVEIDELAHEQCVENFELSDWGDRLFCYHASFDNFVSEMAEEEEKYDLIISNPPFYTDAFETKNDSRNKARFTSALSFESLLLGVTKLLSDSGLFSVIVPFKEESKFIQIAKEANLYLNRVCRVSGTYNSGLKRSLLEFSFHQKEFAVEELVIEMARHNYTEDYINLTKDFYLKM